MAEFTTLKGTGNPFNPVKPVTDEVSHEAMAQLFGKVAQKSMETAIEVNNEKSNAALYQATNQFYRMKHVVEADMRRSPDQAMPLAEGAIKDIRNIVQQTPLNSADRKKLEYLSENDATDIEVKGLQLSSELAFKQSKISFLQQWPEKLQQIHDSWDKDEKTINIQYDNAQKLIENAFASEFITQNQYDSMVETLHKTFEGVEASHKLFEEQGIAKDYHSAKSRFDTRNNFHAIGSPHDQTTNFLYGHQVSQRNYDDVIAAIYNDRQINVETFSNLSPKEQQEVDIARTAINDVKARIASGASWDELEFIHNELDHKKQSVLTTEERAIKSYLDNFMEDFKADKYLSMISNTSIGSQITHDYQMTRTAIETNGAYSPEQKEHLLRQYDNDYSDKMTALGIAKNIPQDRIMPIPSPIISKAQGAFAAGGNPMDLLETIDHYNARNRVYVAQGMKEPEQREVAYTVGSLEGKTSNAMRQMLVAANQPGIDWKNINIGKEGVTETQVRLQVQSELSKVSDYISKLPGGQRGGALVSSITNAVRYAGLQSGDFELKNYRKSINDWKGELNKAYNVVSGGNYAFNRVQQPQVSDYEWASIAQYAIDEGQKYLKEHNPSKRHADFLQAVDINPLYATITPDNYIVAQDQYGKIMYSAPFSSSVLHHAVQSVDKIKMEREERGKKLKELAMTGALK